MDWSAQLAQLYVPLEEDVPLDDLLADVSGSTKDPDRRLRSMRESSSALSHKWKFDEPHKQHAIIKHPMKPLLGYSGAHGRTNPYSRTSLHPRL